MTTSRATRLSGQRQTGPTSPVSTVSSTTLNHNLHPRRQNTDMDSPAAIRRRRRRRVAEENRKRSFRACDRCKARKSKCIESTPGRCQRCSTDNLPCNFKRPRSPPVQRDGSTELVEDTSLITPINTGPTPAQDHRDRRRSLSPAPVLSRRLDGHVFAGGSARASWPKVLSRLREAFSLDPQGGTEEQRMAVAQAQMGHPTGLHHAELARLRSAVDAFPPRPVGSFLLSVLMRQATDSFFYVDQAEFTSEVEQFYSDPTSPLRSDPSFVCLAMSAFALGSQWTTLEKPEGHPSGYGIERTDPGRVFFDHARILIPDIIERPCLRSVQAPFILGVYLLPASAIGSSYVYFGLALRKALALDLHQDVDDQAIDQREIEVRRRLWWSIYSLERCVAVKLHRPRSISASVITAPIPSALPALDREQEFDNLTLQLANMRLMRILDQMSDPEHGSINTGDEAALYAKYEADLKEWKRSLPAEFRLQEIDPQDSRYRAVFHLYLNYYYAWITIGKSPLVSVVRTRLNASATGTQPPPINIVTRNLSRACVRAARKLLSLFETMSMSHKIARFSFTDFQGCSIATIVTLLDGVLERDSGYEARVVFGLDRLRQMAIGTTTAKMGVRFVEAIQMITHEARDKLVRTTRTVERTSQSEGEALLSSGYTQWIDWLNQQEHPQRISEEASLPMAPETMTPHSHVGPWPGTHHPQHTQQQHHHAAGVRPAWTTAERDMFSPSSFMMQDFADESATQHEAHGDYEFLPALHHDDQTFLMELTGLGVLDVSGLSNPFG